MSHKRAGVGYGDKDEPGVGDLAIFCPSCPQPGVNLPDNWKDDSRKFVFLFRIWYFTYD